MTAQVGDNADAKVGDSAATDVGDGAADKAGGSSAAAAAETGDGAVAELEDSDVAEQNGDSGDLLLGSLVNLAVLALVSRSVGMEVTLTELWANITQTKRSLALRQQKLV